MGIYLGSTKIIGSAPPPDWNQNDSTAASYIKNRTHWVEEEWVEVYPETRYCYKGTMGSDLIGHSVFQLGDSAKVIFDGTEYLFHFDSFPTATRQEDAPISLDQGRSGDTTNSAAITLIDSSLQGYHTAAVYRLDTTYKKLAMEYLPFSTVKGELTPDGWADNAITLSVNSVTAGNTVIVAPEPEYMDAWSEAGIRCTGQAEGSLTFECVTPPSAAICVNILIVG